jgi:acyl-CoA dehydrogenase
MSVIGNTTLRFDEEQAMLLDVARISARPGASRAVVREACLEDPPALTTRIPVAVELVELGWTGIGYADEAHGGSAAWISGAAVPVLESMGGRCSATPAPVSHCWRPSCCSAR